MEKGSVSLRYCTRTSKAAMSSRTELNSMIMNVDIERNRWDRGVISARAGSPANNTEAEVPYCSLRRIIQHREHKGKEKR